MRNKKVSEDYEQLDQLTKNLIDRAPVQLAWIGILQAFMVYRNNRVFEHALDIILKATKSVHGVFGYIDEDGALIAASLTSSVWKKCQIPGKKVRFPKESWGKSTWPRCLREKRIICLNQLSVDTPEDHIEMRRHVSVPIVYKGESIGLVQVANKTSDYSKQDIHLLEFIASNLSPILHARLIENKEREETKTLLERVRRLMDFLEHDSQIT